MAPSAETYYFAYDGVGNPIRHFQNGREVLDFLEGTHAARAPEPEREAYLLLLDIHMPQMDGVEVLRAIKEDPVLRPIPVVMLTTTDDPREVQRCHELGCGSYLVKPVEYDRFAEVIQQLGIFMTLVEVPDLSPPPES